MKRRTLMAGGALSAGLAAIWWPRRWHYIVIHHSAGGQGDLELLRRVHRERQPRDPVDMIPYHYVIGNGNGLPLGKVVETERWRRSLWGAHVATIDRNLRGIGVCLIGNFETSQMADAQYRSLVGLTRRLMADHNIGRHNVTLHGKTPGEQTACPGRNFPESRFFRDISQGT